MTVETPRDDSSEIKALLTQILRKMADLQLRVCTLEDTIKTRSGGGGRGRPSAEAKGGA